MGFKTLFSLVFTMRLHSIYNLDFGNIEKYTNLHKSMLEVYHTAHYDEMNLFQYENKTGNSAHSAIAAPVLEHFDSQIEEYKHTGSSVIMRCEPKAILLTSHDKYYGQLLRRKCHVKHDHTTYHASSPDITFYVGRMLYSTGRQAYIQATLRVGSIKRLLGTPTPNITWYKDNVTPVKRTDHGGVLPVTYDMWSLLLNDLVPEDSGNYTCRICNPVGCTEHVHRLTITGYPKQFPYIKKGYPGNMTVLINDSVVLYCPTVNLTDYSVKWAKLLHASGYNNSQEVFQLKDKYTTSYDTLTISYATKDDEGWYMCITNNTIGTDRATGFLRVTKLARVPSKGNPRNNEGTTSEWLTPTLSVLLIISLIIVLVVFLKFKSERLLKTHAVETAREVMFEQWMKVVSIETERFNGYTPEGTLIMPKVKIEKQRLSDIVNESPHYLQSSEYVFPTDTKWEIDRKFLTLGNVLGEGEFGRVVKAKYRNASQSDMPNIVAVKMLKDGHSDADMISIVSEVEIMKMIGKHENIINLLGCCTRDGPFCVVVEYAANGCLRDYLKKHKPIENSGAGDSTENNITLKHKDLVQFAVQVSRGMEYLASRGCIHRDLAARNVLVSGKHVLKVADFGMARDVRDSDYYRKRTAGKLPVRWMAPESLCHNYYTTKSDVWSFGVLTWEILTYGNTPYANIPVHYLYNYLRMGKRMERPKNCSEQMYQLIQHCCTFSPDDRPTFSELKEKLETILFSNAN